MGGAERQVTNLADGLCNNGHVVKICYLTEPCLMLPKNADVELVGLDVDQSLRGIVSCCMRLRNIIRSFSPDVVHSHMFHAIVLARLVRLFASVPKLICSAHSNNEVSRFRMPVYRATAWLSDLNTNVSKDAVAKFEGKGAARLGTMLAVTNGIDTSSFSSNYLVRINIRTALGVMRTDQVILAVGRFDEAKDYPNLFQAYQQFRDRGGIALLWIVGDGDLRADFESLVERMGLGGLVRFLGIQENVPDWLNAADVFVLSSAWEGFGLVVGEAMACEKVVVATDAGGVSELLGDCGFLVPTRDAEALSLALGDALNLSAIEASELGSRARERVIEGFSIADKVNLWVDLYSK
jgi:glycosyltransferase involved in cell wall biosynthesis